jgi:hypothetical protein
MQRIVIAAFCGIVSIAAAADNAGVNAVIERRQTMTRIERPVRSIKQGDAILSVYEDGRLETNAVRVVKMSDSTKAKVAALVDDKETLIAARALAKKVRGGKRAKDVEGLTDAQLVAVADDVLDTSKKDQAAAGVIGAAIVAALAAAKNGKGKNPKSGKS